MKKALLLFPFFVLAGLVACKDSTEPNPSSEKAQDFNDRWISQAKQRCANAGLDFVAYQKPEVGDGASRPYTAICHKMDGTEVHFEIPPPYLAFPPFHPLEDSSLGEK